MAYSADIVNFLCKAEGVEGTAEALTLAEGKIQIEKDYSITEGLPWFNRNVGADKMGDFLGTSGGPQTISFTIRTPVLGSGSAGTAPAIGLLFKAAGFTETVVPATSVAYTPTGIFSSITAAINQNGLETKMHGGKVRSFTYNGDVGGVDSIDWDLEGIYNEPSAVAMVTPTYETTNRVSAKGTTFTLDSRTPISGAFSIRVENKTALRPKYSLSSGGLSIHASPATPHVTGSIDPEIEAPGTYNYFAKTVANTSMVLSRVLGSAAGNILTIAGAAVQFTNPTRDRRDPTVILKADLLFARSSGNDSVTFTFT